MAAGVGRDHAVIRREPLEGPHYQVAELLAAIVPAMVAQGVGHPLDDRAQDVATRRRPRGEEWVRQ